MDSPRQRTPHRGYGTQSDTLILGVWALAIALLPVYVFDSGQAQPSHYALAAAIGLTLATYDRPTGQLGQVVKRIFWFACVVAVVTIVWLIVASGTGSAAPARYIIFNYLVVRAAFTCYSALGDRFIRVAAYTVSAVLPSLVLISLATSSGGTPFRSTVTFNNPNQLAYYVVCAVTLIVVASRSITLDRRLVWLAFLSSAYLAAIANSQAGFVALAIVAGLIARSNVRLLVGVLLAAIAVVTFTQTGSLLLDNASERIESRQNDDTLEARGYQLILDEPEYLILGAGEDYERFGRSLEIHSTIGTVAFSYGLAGMLAFGSIFIALFRLGGVWSIAATLPPLVYGLSHNGLRFTSFWLLLAIIAIVGSRSDVHARNKAGATREGDCDRRYFRAAAHSEG